MHGFSDHPIATAIGVSIIVAAIGGIYRIGFEHGVRVGNTCSVKSQVISSTILEKFKETEAEKKEEKEDDSEEDVPGAE